ncbi:MAG: hypothetical protein KDG89_15445 [Geminicoccaceae bacterium]|nr:hypothetical protein [Geminicoccaceae bacterium]
MRKTQLSAATALTLAFATPAFAGGTHGGGHYSFGEPGDPAKADRTVSVTAEDDGKMAFDMDLSTIRKGETIRFVVANRGELAHEFSIGDTGSQRAHARMMARMPDMHHEDDPTTITMEPGETKEIVWSFSKPIQGNVVFACNIPGHADGGMIHKVAFRPS